MAVVSTSLFVGCDSDDDFTPPNYVTFAENTIDFVVNENSSGSFDVTLYTANTTSSDRTFTINVDEESTLNTAAYSMPTTVVVPANTNEVTFTVDVTDTNIDNSGDTLILSLSGDQGVYTGDPLTVNVARFCEFEPVGTFSNNSGWFEEEYDGVVIVPGASEGQYIVKDMFADGVDITFTINEDLTITVPKQNAWVSATYGQASVTGQAGSKIESCNRTLTLVLQHTVAAGSFGTYPEVLTFISADTDGGDTDGDATGGEGSDE